MLIGLLRSLRGKSAARLNGEGVGEGRRARLRIGYCSADLHEHAIRRASVRLFECHDRDRFETCAYRLDVDDGSALRTRLAAAYLGLADVQSK